MILLQEKNMLGKLLINCKDKAGWLLSLALCWKERSHSWLVGNLYTTAQSGNLYIADGQQKQQAFSVQLFALESLLNKMSTPLISTVTSCLQNWLCNSPGESLYINSVH